MFAWAAVAKLVRFAAWRTAVEGGYGLPRPLAAGARYGAPAAEAAVATLLLGGAVQAGASLALALTGVFGVAILRARSRVGRRLPCGCFGGRSAHDYRAMLALDLALAAAAVVVLASGSGRGVGLAAWVVRQAAAGMRRARRSHRALCSVADEPLVGCGQRLTPSSISSVVTPE